MIKKILFLFLICSPVGAYPIFNNVATMVAYPSPVPGTQCLISTPVPGQSQSWIDQVAGWQNVNLNNGTITPTPTVTNTPTVTATNTTTNTATKTATTTATNTTTNTATATVTNTATNTATATATNTPTQTSIAVPIGSGFSFANGIISLSPTATPAPGASALAVPNVVLVGQRLSNISVTSGVSGGTMSVTQTAHGYTTGDIVEYEANSNAENQLATITVTGANVYTFTTSFVGAQTSPIIQFWFKGVRSLGSNLISNITVPATGRYLVTFTNTQANSWYGVCGTFGASGNQAVFNMSQGVPATTSAFSISCINGGGNLDADQYIFLACTGIQ